MPDPSTTRLSLYKSKSDGSELVTYSQDIGGNWDKVDAAIGAAPVTSTTRPSAPFNGHLIRETDTGRLYVSNGSAPASGSWAEIATPGTAQTFTQQLTLSGSGFYLVKRPTTGDTAYQAMLATDSQPRMLMSAGGVLNWGPGGSTALDTNLYRSGTNTLATDDTFTAPAIIAGTMTRRGVIGTATTVANTTTETTVASLSVPGGEPVVGACYRLKIYSLINSVSGATFTWRVRWGGTSGTSLAQMGPTTTASPTTNKGTVLEAFVQCRSTGATGTVWAILSENRTYSAAAVGQVGDSQLSPATALVTVDTTTTAALVVTAQWGTASASNTITCYARMERVA